MDIKKCAHPEHEGPRELPITEFYQRKRSKDGLHSWCKACCRRNAKKVNLKRRQKESHRRSHLRLKYDLTKQEYDAMVEAQEGCCGICGDEDEELLVDHNHKTGEVRGLLCRKCNTGLGFFKDSELLLFLASKYVHDKGVKNGATETD